MYSVLEQRCWQGSLYVSLTLKIFVVAATSIVMGEFREIKTRNSGRYSIALDESV